MGSILARLEELGCKVGFMLLRLEELGRFGPCLVFLCLWCLVLVDWLLY